MISYSIIQKSQLEGARRLDAEYYQPEYLDLEKKFNALNVKTIEEISKSVISFELTRLLAILSGKNLAFLI